MRTDKLNVDGCRLEVFDSGSTGPLVLMVHGNSSSARSFQRVLESPLGSTFRLVAFSLPGHGQSEAPPAEEAFSLPALSRLVQHLPGQFPDQPYVLVGHSLGGHLFSEALSGLSRARGLVLISAPPLSLPALSRAYKPDPVGGALFKADLGDDDVDSMTSALLGKARQDPAATAVLAADLRRTDRRFRPALAHSIVSGQLGDERATIAVTPVPVAMVWGLDDPFLENDYYQSVTLGRALGQGRYPFANCGHSPHIEQPERFYILLSQLLDEAFRR